MRNRFIKFTKPRISSNTHLNKPKQREKNWFTVEQEVTPTHYRQTVNKCFVLYDNISCMKNQSKIYSKPHI